MGLVEAFIHGGAFAGSFGSSQGMGSSECFGLELKLSHLVAREIPARLLWLFGALICVGSVDGEILFIYSGVTLEAGTGFHHPGAVQQDE